MEYLEDLVTQYETGRISRRTLLAALALLMPSGKADAAPVGTVRQLNHVTIFVPDVTKSVAFYQDLLGLPVLTPQPPGINLNTGAGFLGVYPAPKGGPGSIDHLCLGIEGFDADAVLKQLLARGQKASIRMRGETKEMYFTDPDGIRVQLQDVKYIGGTGPLGDRPPGD